MVSEERNLNGPSKRRLLWRPFNDSALPYPFRVSGAGEFPEYVNSIFGLEEGRVLDKVDALVLLCAEAHGFITTEEVMSIYPVSHNKVSTILTEHSVGLSRRRGVPEYFERWIFKTPVEQSKVFFRLSRLGIKRAFELSGGVFKMKYRPSKQETFLHPYGMGKNLFSLIPLMATVDGFVRIYYEVSDIENGWIPSGYGSLRDNRGGLFTDVVACFYNSDRKRVGKVYIEQDTGSEHINTLIDKLQKYKAKGYMDAMNEDRYGDVIAFSILVNGTYTTSNLLFKRLGGADSFRMETASLTYLRTASEEMKRTGQTVKEFLSSCKDENIEDAITELRQTVCFSWSEINFDSLKADFIKNYIRNRNELRDPFLLRQFNLVNIVTSWHIIKRLVNYCIKGDGRKGFYDPDYIVSDMLYGFPIIFAPTSLMGSALSFFLQDSFEKIWANRIGMILRRYFPGVRYSGKRIRIHPHNLNYHFGDYYLRNVFDTGKGKQDTVCVEFPCYDVGAWIRVYWFLRTQAKDESNEDSEYAKRLPFSVICILDNLKQVSEFFTFMKIEYPYDEVRPRYGGIFAMVRSELMKSSPKLLKGYYDETNDKFMGAIVRPGPAIREIL